MNYILYIVLQLMFYVASALVNVWVCYTTVWWNAWERYDYCSNISALWFCSLAEDDILKLLLIVQKKKFCRRKFVKVVIILHSLFDCILWKNGFLEVVLLYSTFILFKILFSLWSSHVLYNNVSFQLVE